VPTRLARWLLALQLVALASIAFGRDLPSFSGETDFVRHYGPQAQDALNGSLSIDDFRGPLYPLLLATVSRVTGLDVFHAGVWLSVLASLGVTRLILALGEQLSDPLTALAMAFLTLTSVSFLGMSFVASTDMVFLLLALFIVYLFTSCERASSHLLVGTLSGLLVLLRYNALVVVIAGCVWIALRPRAERSWLRASALPMAWYLLGVACLVVPWGLFLLEQRGAFLYNKNYVNLAFSLHGRGDWEAFFYPGPTDRTVNHTSFSSFTEVVRHDPKAAARAIVRGLLVHPWEDTHRLIGLHLAILLVPLPWTARAIFSRLRRHPLGLFGAVFFVGMAPMFYAPRLYLLLLPCYCYALACNLLRVHAWLGAGHFARRAIHIFAACALGVACVHHRARAVDAPYELQRLAEQTSGSGISLRGAAVIARKPHFCYLAGCQHVDLARLSSLDELGGLMCEQNVEYVLFSSSERQTRPALAALTEAEHARRDFALVASVAGTRSAHLYRIVPSRCARERGTTLSSAVPALQR
jgi:hypothetical protein